MTAGPPLLAVPNISEGRDLELVANIAGADGLLDVHSDPDHHRSVLTYGGSAEELVVALAAMIERAASSLDIRKHEGVHPRFGVVDVLPIVPYDATDDDARALLADLTWRVAQGPGITMLTYGRASDDGRTLPQLRRELRDDPAPQHPTAGVICVGIRDPLVAFNVNLDASLDDAVRIATEVRTDSVRTLAFELPSQGLVQVSMNLTDPLRSGPRAAFDSVAERTDRIVAAELVGLAPEAIIDQFSGLPMLEEPRSIEAAWRG